MSHNTENTIDPAELLRALESYEARIPHFRQLTNKEIITLRKAATLDPEWVTKAISALGASPTAQSIVGATDEELLVELRDATEWALVEGKLRALLRGVAAANLIRRHRIGQKALRTYAITRLLVRDREHAALIPFVETLREMNKLGKRKKKPAAPPEES